MSERFYPADWATTEFYTRAARELLPKLGAASTEAERQDITDELRDMFQGTKGILQVREGEVGMAWTATTTYDPAVVTSMLPDWGHNAIVRGQVREFDLKQLIKKLARAGVIEREYGASILQVAAVTQRTHAFIARPADAAYLARWDEEHAALRPAAPKLTRFKGYAI